MNLQNEFRELSRSPLLFKRAVIGAGIALTLVTLFLITAGEPNPEWPRFWKARPLILIPLAGACGGLFYHFMDILRNQTLGKKILAFLLSVIVYIIGFYLGFVLGFDGMYWD